MTEPEEMGMKALLIASAAFATLIFAGVTEADARFGRGGGYGGGGGHRGMAVGRWYRGGLGRPGWGAAGPIAGRHGAGRPIAGRPGWGAAGPIAGRPGRVYGGGYYRGGAYGYGLVAAGVGAAAYYGANAAYYSGCGPYAYFDPNYGVCRPY